ncbi:MAG: hypothetical protein R3F41_18605 [Gammaproteobacteria bacterium]|nr:hypothetical protein [Pseudomonadales bacterium]MCP5347563.1 hypothetical protein [Pseudomonadales bacterium]
MKRKSLRKLAGLVSLCSLFVMPLTQAQDFVWAPDFPVGTVIADIEAPDQNGEIKTFQDLVGENGLLLMFSRSFDW